MSGKYYIIGIGNPDRGDDGVGRYVAAQLQDKISTGITILEQDGEFASLLFSIEQAGAVWLIDASRSQGTPIGTIQRFDAADGPLPRSLFNLSTHGFGVAEAVELARATKTLPSRCIIYAIEGEDFNHGRPLSVRVMAAATQLVDTILMETAVLQGDV